MDRSSYFIPDKALFGSYPNQESVKELESNGVTLFVNLTENNDVLPIYKLSQNSTMLHYPIPDRKIPYNEHTFILFIIKIIKHIRTLVDNQKCYIHCRGGHGRAGIVVATLLCYIYNITPESALALTTKYHSERKEMRPKWRAIGSPQTRQQKHFVTKLFSPMLFYKAFRQGPTTGFSNFSAHPVKINNLGTFPTSEAAFNAFKDPHNKQYINKLIDAKTPFIAKELSQKCNLRDDWYENRDKFMYEVVWTKVHQHKEFHDNLIFSGLRPIIHHTKKDKFWGDGPENNGLNILGKILMKIREKLLYELC